jgi:tripartite-type tricarboxylate transporter receptor subunit TctC
MGMGSLKHGSFRSSTFLVGTLALLLATSGARAQQQFPTQPIRLIVPAAADSVLDLVARALALQLTEAFKQPVVVDNRPGNSGSSSTIRIDSGRSTTSRATSCAEVAAACAAGKVTRKVVPWCAALSTSNSALCRRTMP